MTLTPELIPLLNTTGLASKDNRLYQVLQSIITNLAKAESNLVLVATTANTASTASSNAITALSGDVTAVGPGAVISTLSTTGVVAGTYGSSTSIPIITVNTKGRVTTLTTTAVSTGGTTGITQLTGDVLAGPGTGSQASTLSTTGVTAGTYGSSTAIPIITFDAKGRATTASTTAFSTGSATTGAITLIQTQTPTGTGVVSFTTLGSYKHLHLIANGRGTAAATSVVVQITLNSDTTTNYQNERIYGNGNTPAAAQSALAYIYGADMAAANAPANIPSSFELLIPDYAGTTFYKSTLGRYNLNNGTTGVTNYFRFEVGSWWLNSNAITRIDATLSSGNWATGSILSLYGITG